MDIVGNAVVTFFVWLFAVAAWHKLTDTAYYQDLIRAYLWSSVPARFLARCIGLLELLLVSLLLYSPTRDTGLMLVASLLLVYAVLMLAQLQRSPAGAHIKCGCAGPGSDTRVSFSLVCRNVLCAGLATAVLAARVPVEPDFPGWFLSAFAGLFLVQLYLCAEQLINNAQRFQEGRL